MTEVMAWGAWLSTLPWVRGALTGLWAAFFVDLLAFLKWKSWDEAAAFQIKVAALRWAQGAISGALAGAGFGALS